MISCNACTVPGTTRTSSHENAVHRRPDAVHRAQLFSASSKFSCARLRSLKPDFRSRITQPIDRLSSDVVCAPVPVTSSVLAPPLSYQSLICAAGNGDLINQPHLFFAADNLPDNQDSLRFQINSPTLTARRNVAVATTRICGCGISTNVQQIDAGIASRVPSLRLKVVVVVSGRDTDAPLRFIRGQRLDLPAASRATSI